MNTSKDKDPVCETLCSLLGDGIDIHRTIAAQALGHMGYTEAVPELIVALHDEDEDVRTDAATALSELKDPRSAEPLMENLLGDPCPEVKLAAIDALTSLQHQEVVPWLRKMIKGRDEEIIWDEEEFYETGWDDWVDVQVKVIKSLASFRDEASVPDIVEALNDENAQDITELAFAALGQMGEAGVDALILYSQAKDSRKRRRAVVVLGQLTDDKASKAVIKALRDEAPDVRTVAGMAIAKRNPEDKYLEMLLIDKVAEVRATFVPICGKFHPTRLASLLFEQSPEVQTTVLQVLVKSPNIIEDMALRGRLLEIFEGPAEKPAGLAAQVMMAVAPADMETEIILKLQDADCPQELKLGIIKALAVSDTDESMAALKDVLSGDYRQGRLDAMIAISARAGSVGDWPNMASEVLLAALRGEVVVEPEPEAEADETEPEADEREQEIKETSEEQPADDVHMPKVAESIDAAQPMMSLTTPKEVVEKTVEDIAEDVVEEDSFPNSTMASLMGAESQSMDAALAGEENIVMTDEDMEFLALTHRSPKKKKVGVIEIEVAPHQDVRRFAARILGDFVHPDVAIGLAHAMAGLDKELTVAAADSLALVGAGLDVFPDESIEALLGMVEDNDDDIRFAVTRALAKAGTEGAANLLKARVKDHNSFVRSEAISGLAYCGQVDDDIEACLTDDIPAVRLIAAEALTPEANPQRVQRLVDFAYEYEGYHGRAIGKMLAGRNADLARSLFVDTLKDESKKRIWKVAIEALQELGRPEAIKSKAA